MERDNKKTVVVLGMHRSGTSTVAGILNKLGIYMGDDLLKANHSNPVGHFENKKFIELNDKILKSAGGRWDWPPTKDVILMQRNKFEKDIINLIKSESITNIWGWKDPRTSLTIDLYYEFLENPHFIICTRDDNDVGRSLYKRGDMTQEEGALLSEIYKTKINNFLESHKDIKKITINFDALIKDPREIVSRIIDFLKINLSEQQIAEAISHVKTPDEIVLLRNKASDKWSKFLYELVYDIRKRGIVGIASSFKIVINKTILKSFITLRHKVYLKNILRVETRT